MLLVGLGHASWVDPKKIFMRFRYRKSILFRNKRDDKREGKGLNYAPFGDHNRVIKL